MTNQNLSIPEFKEYLQQNGGLYNDDFVALFLPLLKHITRIHEENKVARIYASEALQVRDRSLVLLQDNTFDPELRYQALKALEDQAKQQGVFEITERLKQSTDVGTGDVGVESQELYTDDNKGTIKPSYFLNYQTYEQQLGHYDQKTELFVLGMIMASFAFDLDFSNHDDLEAFVRNRGQLYHLNPRIHPNITFLIGQLTQLDRHKRTRETYNLIWQLENYKDFDTENQIDITLSEGFIKHENTTRNAWVLDKLKSRLFEISRRNKLLYFKAGSKFLNLTVASVPTVLYYENIQEKDLFLWHKQIANKVKSQEKISLNKYLQFDDAGYVGSNLDKIRNEARKDINEYGFSQLKLVLTFLNWYNFKEDKSEKITSPLLIMPAILTKKVGVKDDYTLQLNSTEAEVNPVLVHQLKELYNIDLPDSIDLEKVDVHDFYQKLSAIISDADKDIKLVLADKPRIKLIQSVAKQKATSYQKKNRYRTQEFNVSNFNYSYNSRGYNPLGNQIFKKHIRPQISVLEYLVNEDVKLSNDAFAQTKTRNFYSIDNDGDSNPYQWEYDMCNITLGNFNYKKMSLVRDYATILDEDNENTIFSELFSDAPKKLENLEEKIDAYEDNFYVLNADATQAKAISKAKTGGNIIIQGPPGTGKSQTITNLIADFASRGKRILFVCEKRAALDVVYARLKQRNIHHLASLIHDSQTDKKEFIMDAKATYEKFILEESTLDQLSKTIKEKKERIKDELAKIEEYHELHRRAFDQIGISFISFIDRLLFLRNENLANSNKKLGNEISFAEWKKVESTLNEFSEGLDSLGLNKSPSKYSLKCIGTEILNDPSAINITQTAINEVLNLCSEWVELGEMHQFSGLLSKSIMEFKAYCSFAKIALNLVQKNQKEVLNGSSIKANELDALLKELKTLQADLESVTEENAHWESKLDKQETTDALAIAKKFEGKFYAFIIPSFGKVKKLLRSCYDFSHHKLAPSFTSILEKLEREYALHDCQIKSSKNIENNYGFYDLEHLENQVSILRNNKPLRDELLEQNEDVLKTLADLESEFVPMINHTQKLGLSGNDFNLETIESRLKQMDSDIKTLPTMLPYLRAFSTLSTDVQNLIKNHEHSLEVTEYMLAESALKKLYHIHFSLSNARGSSLKFSINSIQKLHKELLTLNGEFLIEKYKSAFKYQLRNSELLAKQQNEQGKRDKKAFLKSRKILENEFNKSMRYKSIRDLKSNEATYILDIIKPIWLMSPLSVSDTLPVDSNLFDLVIFDEASQITLEEGVPTLFRSNQAVIVGDEMQMPPTNFFSASSGAKDIIEDENNAEQIVIDADSMLTHASNKLEDVMLSWHFRSQHESLIGFSNAAFYKGDLLTIPDKHLDKEKNIDEDHEAELHWLDDVISFHHQKDAVYTKRKNNAEASYIAEMLKELLINKPELSVGIVAFSMEQQDNIERAIDGLAHQNKAFAEILEKAYTRTKDGQDIGVFVKNLENVQGDERDVIIISVCYGYNPQGKMLMNFGPINRKGGEKRLNVIFSRAKKHMAIVSSIQYKDIKNEYNEGANYLRKFLQYAENLAVNKTLATNVLSSLAPLEEEGDKKPDDLVLEQIGAFIKQLGYQYNTHVGMSKFKISLAVKSKTEANKYCLGIVLDSENFYNNQNTLDQYVLRPGLLSAFGWKNTLVFRKDWLDQPDFVKEQLKLLLEGKNEQFVEVPTPQSSVKEETKTTIEEPIEDEKQPESAGEYLEYSDEKSEKFWEVVQVGKSLKIRFGRKNSKGREMEKSFDSEELATLEMTKMVSTKLKKGYNKR
jgi:superfamily I DNA and/or RNA helicase/predicted DNA-binding WGR domain protein